MVQKVLPKGPRVLPPKCDFQKMRSGECSVHILRGPCLNRDTLTTINLSFLVMEIGLEHGRQVKVASVLKHHWDVQGLITTKGFAREIVRSGKNSCLYKVQMLWEGHIWGTSKQNGRFFQIFVAFSEYLNCTTIIFK